MSQGIEAPIDVRPWLLEKEGMRINHGHIISYISKDLQDHQQIYGTIARVYADLFEKPSGSKATGQGQGLTAEQAKQLADLLKKQNEAQAD
jgi:hypothetical protein